MAMRAGVVQLIGGVTDFCLISGLRSLVCGASSFREFRSELFPVGIIHWNEFPVFAAAARRQHQSRSLAERNSGVVHKIPSSIYRASPGQPIKPSCRAEVAVAGRLLGAGIDTLRGEDNVGTRERECRASPARGFQPAAKASHLPETALPKTRPSPGN